MPARNDITGDELLTSVPNEKYREGWDRIFNKPKPAPKPLNESVEPLDLEPSTPPTIKPYPEADEGNTPD